MAAPDHLSPLAELLAEVTAEAEAEAARLAAAEAARQAAAEAERQAHAEATRRAAAWRLEEAVADRARRTDLARAAAQAAWQPPASTAPERPIDAPRTQRTAPRPPSTVTPPTSERGLGFWLVVVALPCLCLTAIAGAWLYTEHQRAVAPSAHPIPTVRPILQVSGPGEASRAVPDHPVHAVAGPDPAVDSGPGGAAVKTTAKPGGKDAIAAPAPGGATSAGRARPGPRTRPPGPRARPPAGPTGLQIDTDLSRME